MKRKEFNESYINARRELVRLDKNKKPPREGRDRLPPGQFEKDRMVAMPPITSDYPRIGKSDWRLRIYGSVKNEKELDWNDFLKLPSEKYIIDFHCVTHWSKLSQKFTGVPFEEILKLARPLASTKFVIFECYDGYTTNLNLRELKENICFIAFEMDGKDIETKFGGPARVIIPHLYAWKSAKFLKAIRFQEKDEPGFWESRGYHNHGDPWKEERYS